ncbi:MAG: hypothetical protein LUD77_09980 [Clostridiales bacterium]|nr:hypothetical protein [Clostridiales bacterium]
MNRFKKVIGIMLVIVMGLSFSVLTNADDTIAKFTLTLSSEEINAGEEFTVSVDL